MGSTPRVLRRQQRPVSVSRSSGPARPHSKRRNHAVAGPGTTGPRGFFVAELEKRGIYIDFNLLVGRPFMEGDGVHDAKLLRQGAKGTSLFDAKLIELQKQYVHQLLGHLNPYTKLEYTNDPAVAIVEINNERLSCSGGA